MYHPLRISQFNNFAKIIHHLNVEQDYYHPSRSKNNACVVTNNQYATLPGLQPVHNGNSHKEEIPAKSIRFVTINNAHRTVHSSHPTNHSSTSARSTRCPLCGGLHSRGGSKLPHLTPPIILPLRRETRGGLSEVHGI